MQIKNTVLACLSLILMVTLAACSDDDTTTSPDNSLGVYVTKVFPSDGATGISTNASISVAFSGPVDSQSIMGNLSFSGGPHMHEWMDSLDHYGGMDQMGMGQRTHMMDWMDSIHITGEFHWNGQMDSCQFVPDSAMAPNTEYMIFMNEGGMMDMDGSMMNHGNGMMNMGNNDDGYHTYHFTTGALAE